ncbi:hypothetical protein MKX03_000606 [Papaver bracteatum]|nr:hypothetical protein MKX03_000606 [Papaver bracteatum]
MQKMETTRNPSAARRQNMTAEQLAGERQMDRDRHRIHRQNMTEEQRSIVRERDRIRYRARRENPNLPSTSTGNNDARLFETVLQQHVHAEVRQIVGRVSTMPMNATYELGSVLQRGNIL